jgi:DNA-binding transcriptional LysR family regulator
MRFIIHGDNTRTHGSPAAMNLRAIDLNLLPVFEAVYVSRSLTRAAETLNMTQPAASNALARLRAAFDDELFVRAGRGMSPTPAAQALIAPVREALGRLRAGLESRDAFEPAHSERVFNIAGRDVAGSALLPMLARALEAAPGVRVQCHPVDRADIGRELASGRLDFAIDVPVLARPELESAVLFKDRYVLALRRGHARARGRLTLKDFVQLRHILVSSRRAGRTLIEAALAREGERLKPAMRLDHYQPAFHTVMASDLAVAAPASLARRYDVAVRPLPFAAPELETLLFWRRDADEAASRWAREAIIAAGRAAKV